MDLNWPLNIQIMMLVGKNSTNIRCWRCLPSIILALNNMDVRKIFISNRTRSKAENLKKLLTKLKLLNGEFTRF